MNTLGRITLPLLVLTVSPCFSGTGFHVITTAHGNGADTFIYGGSANSNYGASTALLAKGSANRKVYVRFDVSGLPKPFAFASLELTVQTAANRLVPVYGLNDGSAAGNGRLGEDWGESEITWNNAPAHTNVYAAVEGTGIENGGECQLLGQVEFFSAVSPAGTRRVLLSGGPLLDFLNADTDGLVTFILTAPGTVDISWKSKEHEDNLPPRLLLGDATARISTLNPTADAYVDDNAPLTTKGTEDQVIVRSNNGLLKGYLRFDLSSIRRPIQSAALFVTQSSTTWWDTLVLYGLNDGTTPGEDKLGEFWFDAEICAENAPANDIGTVGFSIGESIVNGGQAQPIWTTRIGATGADALGRRHLLVAEQPLVDFLNADTNDAVTILMHATTTTGTRSVRFASRENTTYAPPSLVLVETALPSGTLIFIR